MIHDTRRVTRRQLSRHSHQADSHQADSHQADSHQADSHQADSHLAGAHPADAHTLLILIVALVCAPFSGGSLLQAQTSKHERVGVTIRRPLALTLAAGMDASPAVTDRGEGAALSCSLSVDILVSGTWNLSATIPWSVQAISGRECPVPVISAPGDPELGLGFTSRFESWRLGVDLSWSRPMGISDRARAEIFAFSSGSGSDRFTLGARANRFFDPLSVGASLALSGSESGTDRFGAAGARWHIKAAFSVTEALNRNAVLGISIIQTLAGRAGESAAFPGSGLRYGAVASASLTLTDGIRSLRIGASANLADPSSPGSIHLSLSRTLDIGRKR